ncbi:MAG: hypothetical protein ACLSAF_15745 [Intestinimonas sp.]
MPTVRSRCSSRAVTAAWMEEGHTVAVSLAMLAQAVVREGSRSHCYPMSTARSTELNAERRPYTFYRLMEHTERRVMVREILETVTPAREVCDVYVTVGAVSQSREGSQVNLSAETTVNVVYRGEDGSLCTVARTLPCSCSVELAEGASCTCRYTCPENDLPPQRARHRGPLSFGFPLSGIDAA